MDYGTNSGYGQKIKPRLGYVGVIVFLNMIFPPLAIGQILALFATDTHG
jgi:hypothetical protein